MEAFFTKQFASPSDFLGELDVLLEKTQKRAFALGVMPDAFAAHLKETAVKLAPQEKTKKKVKAKTAAAAQKRSSARVAKPSRKRRAWADDDADYEEDDDDDEDYNASTKKKKQPATKKQKVVNALPEFMRIKVVLKPLPLNRYGNVDVSRGPPAGVVWLRGKRLQPLARAALIPYAQGVIPSWHYPSFEGICINEKNLARFEKYCEFYVAEKKGRKEPEYNVERSKY